MSYKYTSIYSLSYNLQVHKFKFTHKETKAHNAPLLYSVWLISKTNPEVRKINLSYYTSILSQSFSICLQAPLFLQGEEVPFEQILSVKIWFFQCLSFKQFFHLVPAGLLLYLYVIVVFSWQWKDNFICCHIERL